MVTRHGQRFRDALAAERPLQVAGAINAYTARLAERAGFHALYVSGAGVANASFGLPDLGFTTLDQAVHLEDQVSMKRCGHRPGKALVSTDEMVERVEAAAVSKPDPAMVLMARTDAAAVEGVPAAIARAQAYVAAGADMIFAEALTTLDEYRAFIAAVNVPVLANITEFGKTPLFTVEELRGAGIAMVLYPLSAFRAMSAAARDVYAAIRRDGSQRAVVDRMQTRTELYEVLDYLAYEKKADDALNKQP